MKKLLPICLFLILLLCLTSQPKGIVNGKYREESGKLILEIRNNTYKFVGDLESPIVEYSSKSGMLTKSTIHGDDVYFLTDDMDGAYIYAVSPTEIHYNIGIYTSGYFTFYRTR